MASSSKTTTSSGATTAVSTPTAPSWIQDPAQAYAGKVADLIGANPQQFVAPASALQTQAFTGASNLGPTWQNTLAQATGLVNQATGSAAPTYAATGYLPNTATAATIDPTTNASAGSVGQMISNGGLAQYLNPETDAVVNSTLTNYDKQAGVDQAKLAATAGLNKAFGGSGYAIGNSNLLNSQELGRASTEAGLRQTAFNTATGLAAGDADRATQVAQTNAAAANARAAAQAQMGTNVSIDNAKSTNDASAFTAGAENKASADNQAAVLEHIKTLLNGGVALNNLGNSQATNAQGDVNTQLAAGDTQRTIDANQRTAPLNLLETLKSLLGYDPSQFIGKTVNGTSNSTSTETSTPSMLDSIGKIAGVAATALGVPGGGGFSSLFNSGGSYDASGARAGDGSNMGDVLSMFA